MTNPGCILKRTALAAVALGMLCAGVAQARSDVNSVVYKETFESTTGPTTGSWADNAWVATTGGWYAAATDASIVTNIGSYVLPSGVISPVSPTTGAAWSRVLKLNTEGVTLTNMLSGATLDTKDIWVDTLIKMVVSEDVPTAISNDVNVKAAVYLNSSSNLVVYHGTFNVGGSDYGHSKYTATGAKLVPGEWYRLTIRLDSTTTPGEEEAFKVFTNGGVVVAAAGVGYDDWKTEFATVSPPGGPWFLSAARRPSGYESTFADTVQTLCFQGTGYVDDLVVTDSAPSFDVPSVVEWTITQTVGAGGSGSPVGSITVADNGSTSIVYTANEWYRISAITVDTVDQGVSGVASHQLDLGPVTEDLDVAVTFAQATQAQTGLGVPSGWASGYYATEALALADANIELDYLLNLNPTGTYDIGLAIQSIDVDVASGDVTVVVKLTDGVNPLDTTINGELTLLGATTVGGSYVEIAGAELDNADFNASGEATVDFTDVDLDDYLAVKAIIRPID
jgi:hypothetical protein